MTDLLADLRVVDLTDGYGAYAGRVLADLGAEVVRIEEPGGGEGRRRAPRAADGTSLHHALRNVGKLVVTLDPDDEGDRPHAPRPARRCGAGAGVRRLGGGPTGADPGGAVGAAPAPRRRVRHAVRLEGPAADRAATELVAQCLGGVVYRSGVPELPPVAAPGSYCEDVGAVVAAMGGLIALHQAADDGVGQVVDVSSHPGARPLHRDVPAPVEPAAQRPGAGRLRPLPAVPVP